MKLVSIRLVVQSILYVLGLVRRYSEYICESRHSNGPELDAWFTHVTELPLK